MVFSTPIGSFEGFDRNPFARVLLGRKEVLRRAAKLLRDCDATDVEVSALVRDVVVVESHCVVGRPTTPSFGAGADNDLKYAT